MANWDGPDWWIQLAAALQQPVSSQTMEYPARDSLNRIKTTI